MALYTKCSEQLLGSVADLQLSGLGWGDDQVEYLAEVLPLCKSLRSINLSRNTKVGDRGIVALVKALAAPGVAPRVKEVYLQQIPIGNEATLALRRISVLRDTVWYV